MRTPLVYTASEIVNWHIAEEYNCGKWRPARPIGFSGFKHLAMRLRICWKVFIGKYDALNWQNTGEKSSKTNYVDCLDPNFKNIIMS